MEYATAPLRNWLRFTFPSVSSNASRVRPGTRSGVISSVEGSIAPELTAI